MQKSEVNKRTFRCLDNPSIHPIHFNLNGWYWHLVLAVILTALALILKVRALELIVLALVLTMEIWKTSLLSS